jgi:hypothetical protein
MLDYTTVRATVEKYIGDNFTTVKVLFENTYLESVDEEHIAINEDDTESTSLEMNSSVRQVDSSLFIDIYTKRGIGTEKAREIASELVTLLEAMDSGINFREPIFSSDGAVDGAKLYKHVLIYPYTYIYGQAD